ncbi:MAG TPA: ABC transporter ATP-binding protein [Candidatus Saccharimonadales bacterium]
MLIALPIAGLLLDTLLPYFLAQAVGTLTSHDGGKLYHFLLLAGTAAAVGVCLNLIGFQMAIRHESNVRHELVKDTMNKLLAKDHDFFANQKVGALTGKFIDFVNGHVGLQDLFILRTLWFVITMGSGITILFMSSPIIGLLVLGLLIGLLVQIRLSIKLRKPLRTARKELIGELNGATADMISNNLTVKTFAKEKHEVRELSKISNRYRNAYIKDFRWMSVEGSSRLAVMSAVQIIAISILANLLFTNQIELGIAIFAIAYLQRIAGQLFMIGDIVNGYDRIFLQAAPMSDVLQQIETVNDISGAKKLVVQNASIDLKSVSYAYDGAKEKPVINDVDLHIPAGQKIGLIGQSGAGKTTITKLLLRFADIDKGEMLIDGQNIAKVTQSSLRESIAYVPQEPLLFHRSLRENIAYSTPNATDEQILDAAKKANALDFIKQLPEGLDTTVGERGVKLSGGQRQRIAIARALLKNAPILVLDEATSALDSESEKMIQDALEKLMKNRTSIVIAHRLSTIAKLDRIIVLDQGKIVEDGTHQELLAQNGIYAKLWSHQSGGFIEE